MSCVLSPSRRIAFVCAAVLSVGAGLVLILTLVTPRHIALIRTPELLGMLALLMLPLAAYASLRRTRRAMAHALLRERHARRAAPATGEPSAGPAPAGCTKPATARAPLPPAPTAPVRPATPDPTKPRVVSVETWQIVIPVHEYRRSRCAGPRPDPAGKSRDRGHLAPAAARR
jgi:hypothetical protein